MNNRQEKRQFLLVGFALSSIFFLGEVLYLGIRFNSFEDPLWWLALLSVVVLVAALITVYRRMFH